MAKKIRNPFKKQSIIDCAINVGLGGASNVAIDYAIDMVKESAGVEIEDMYVNIGKFVIGAVGSSMVTNKYLKSAMDGVAVVGVSNLVKGLMEDSGSQSGEGATPAAGVPAGTVGRIVRTPNIRYARAMRGKADRKVSGIANMVG